MHECLEQINLVKVCAKQMTTGHEHCTFTQKEPMEQKHFYYFAGRMKKLIAGTPFENHVYCVGGCPRDLLMKREIKDIDLTVDLPDGGKKFANWLREHKQTYGPIIPYKRYGTVCVRLRCLPGNDIEIVQTSEPYHSEENNLQETVFAPIDVDATHRDLTINALYYNISKGKIMDPTRKGKQDISKKIIRAVGDAKASFTEDPKRILRCLRFAAHLDWTIDEQTFRAIMKQVPLLESLSAPRIGFELVKMMSVDHPSRLLELLRDTGAMHWILPEVEELYEHPERWQHICSLMEALDPAQPEIRLAALLHNLEKGLPASVQKIPIEGLAKAASTAVYAKKILKRFMYPGKMVDNILHCIAHHRDFRSWDSEDIPSFLPKIRQLQYLCVTEERFDNLLNFISLHDNSKDTDKILQEIHLASTEMQEEGTSMFSYELPYNSKEVMNMLGPEHSIYTGKCIHYLQQLACENPVRTCNEWRKLMKAFIKDIKEKSNTLTTKKKKRKKRRYYQHNMKKKQI